MSSGTCALTAACISDASADGQTYDAEGCYVIPGLTDLHFHGCMGHDFSDADPEGLEIMADYELSRGVTQICPAGMTLLEEQLTRSARWPPPTGGRQSPAPRCAASTWRALPVHGQEGRPERRLAPRP